MGALGIKTIADVVAAVVAPLLTTSRKPRDGRAVVVWQSNAYVDQMPPSPSKTLPKARLKAKAFG